MRSFSASRAVFMGDVHLLKILVLFIIIFSLNLSLTEGICIFVLLSDLSVSQSCTAKVFEADRFKNDGNLLGSH